MRKYDPTRALAAIHVPKCAGSNTSPRSEEATDEMRQEFRDRHELEYEVYDYALQLHRREMARRTGEPVEAE